MNMTVRLKAAKVGGLILLVFIAAGVGMLLSAASGLFEAGGTTAGVLDLLAVVCWFLAGGLAGWAAWSLLVRVLAWIVPLLATEDVEIGQKAEEPKTPEQAEIQVVTTTLDDTLEAIENGRADALALANDLAYYCQELSSLIKAFVRQAEQKLREAELISQGMRAVEGRAALSSFELGQAIGAIPDSDLREMCRALCLTNDPTIADRVSQMTGEYVSALNAWGQNYLVFAGNRIDDLAAFKLRVAKIREIQSYALSSPAVLRAENILTETTLLLENKQDHWTRFTQDYRPRLSGRARELPGQARRQLGARVN